MEQHYTRSDIDAMDRFFRANFINGLSGIRTVHLIGTKGLRGQLNLAIFNTVIHVGANPPLLGFLVRPLTVPRHTYHHIKATRVFTLNQVHEAILSQAHQTSAGYALAESEFEACGLVPWYSARHEAPYVAESRIKVGLRYVEEHNIQANGTLLLVGQVEEVWLPRGLIMADGHFDPEKWDSLGVAGLENYYRSQWIRQMAYARPGDHPQTNDKDGSE